MSINGIESFGSLPGSDPSPKAQRPDSENPAEGPGDEPRIAGQDRAEISSAARELARLSDAAVTENAPVRSLDAEHMRTIMARLSDGFYDSPEVQLEIANRILATGHEPMSGADQF